MTSFLFYNHFDFFISLCKVFKMIAIIFEFYFVKSVRMKKVCLFLLAVSCLFNVTAQQPQKFSYQTVVRGADNLLVVNKMIGIRISLLQGSENGDVVYVEKHTPTTNANGLASIAIGTGSIVSGNFAAINWSKGPYFIKTETDPAGVSNYTLTTTSQLLSVPYALYAGNGIKRISANSDTIFLSNDSYYINKSSTSTGNSSIPSGGGQNQVLTRCDGELAWTNEGVCPGKISSLDCNYTVVQQGVFVKNVDNGISAIYKFNYKGGNAGGMVLFNAQSSGVYGLNASLKSVTNLLNNGDGSFEIIVQGKPSSSGKANFSFTFCGKSCSFSVDVLESNISSLDCNYTVVQGKLVKNDSSSITLRFNYTGGNLGTGSGDYIYVQSTGVVGLKAQGGVDRLNNGNGSFDVIVTGNPTSSGKANFAFTFCGRACSFSLDVLETIGKYQSPLTDIDGNEYKTTLIGKQVWMAENLKVTRFNDGTIIKAFVPSGNYTSDSVARLGSIWSYYNNDASNSKHGKLYTWYAVSPNTNGNKNICPFGWHVPTQNEFQELISYLGGYTKVVKKLKQTGIIDWSLDASNSSLFSALPSGYMDYKGRSFQLNTNALWWTSTGELDQPGKIGSSCSYIIDKDSWNNYHLLIQSYRLKSFGLSIRCIKD